MAAAAAAKQDEDLEDEEIDIDLDNNAEVSTNLFPKPTTPQQREAFDGILLHCGDIARVLYETNQLFNPGTVCLVLGLLNMSELDHLGDNDHAQTYYDIEKMKHGQTGNGKVRDAHYNDDDIRLCTFDIDRQNREEHKNFINAVIVFMTNVSEDFPLDRLNKNELTIQNAVDLEKTQGLPFCFTLLCLILTKSMDDCPKLGGGISIIGMLKRVALCIVECGLSAISSELSIKENESLQPSEFVLGTLGWVGDSFREIAAEVAYFKEKLANVTRFDPDEDESTKTTDDDVSSADTEHTTSGDNSEDEKAHEDGCATFLEFLLKFKIIVLALSSWKPNIPHDDVGLTVILLNLIVGLQNWWDAFHNDKPPKDDPYNSDKFNAKQRERARGRIRKWFGRFMTAFGIGYLDRNNAAYKNSGMNVEDDLKEHGWKHFYSFGLLDAIVFIFYRSDGSWPSLVFVHESPCFMATSAPGIKVTHGLIERMRKRAKEMFLLFLLKQIFSNENAPMFEVDTDLNNYSIFGNILLAHTVYVHLVANVHIRRMSACLVFKNLLIPMNMNAFDDQYHGMSVEGDPKVVAANIRRNNGVMEMDVVMRTVNRLGHIQEESDIDQCFEEALVILKIDEDRLLYHFNTLMTSGILAGELLEKFQVKKNELYARREQQQQLALEAYKEELAAGKAFDYSATNAEFKKRGGFRTAFEGWM